MTRLGLIAGLTATIMAAAAGQSYTPPTTTGVSPWPPTVRAGVSTSPYAPNFYNRQSQPLSPYLNLFRGVDPVTNYYYGVRPGVVTGNPVQVVQQVPPLTSQLRTGFLPAASNPTQETTVLPDSGADIPSLPPAGHPVVYGGGPGRSATPGRPGVLGNQPPAAFGRRGGAKR